MTATKVSPRKISPYAAWMQEIINVVYPEMFSEMEEIRGNLWELQEMGLAGRLPQLFQQITREMQQMNMKEKSDLFPYIDQLAASHSLSADCVPFQNLNGYFDNLEFQIGKMKQDLETLEAAGTAEILVSHILASLKAFEKKHIYFRLVKDKYLYRPFKKCATCNELPACNKETAGWVAQVYQL